MSLLAVAIHLTVGLQRIFASAAASQDSGQARQIAGYVVASASILVWCSVLFAGRWMSRWTCLMSSTISRLAADRRLSGRERREAHVSNEDLAGRDGSVAEFLMGATNFTVLVEIKRPDTDLFEKRKNRAGSWKLSAGLIDAVSQILEQKASWQVKREAKASKNYTANGELLNPTLHRTTRAALHDRITSGTEPSNGLVHRNNTLSHSNGPSLLPIERPRCPKCHDRMHVTRIAPGPKGLDLRNSSALNAIRRSLWPSRPIQ